MCASPLSLLRAGPPPPKVALLPDAMFFTRAVPISAGATASEAASQVELALEAVAPFPLAQLYYGWFWVPGTESAFVFAAYRRRFTTDQAAEWSDAELVLPSFGAVLGAKVEPATTVILNSVEGVTAVHWADAPVPAKVLFIPLEPEATDEDRARVRDELIRTIGGSKTVVDLATPVAADSADSDSEVVFRSGDFVSHVPAVTAASLDVRDKGELAALRNARKRDVLLWRIVVGSFVGLLLLVVGELALVGGRQWQKVRVKEYTLQKPTVDKITSLHELANRIDEIATKRLLPIEMVEAAAAVKPADVTFTRAIADRSRGLNTLVVSATTANGAQINVYEAALRALPTVESAIATIEKMSNDRTNFYITVTFKADALKPHQLAPSTPPPAAPTTTPAPPSP
ncbi:MAG: hypothetical protein V4773_20335 [Verrucomicrobiota bacterium]